jgi:hypothetical protein
MLQRRKAGTVPPPGFGGRTARRRISAYLLAMHAISPEDATPYSPPAIERDEFERLLAAGIVLQPIKGHYWLDRAALKAAERAAEQRLVPGVILACIVAAGLLLLLYRG